MRVLLVEDNTRLAEFVAIGLKGQGFAVDHVEGGEDAVGACKAVRYDAVILDLGLPDIDGMAVLSRLRNAGVGVPVIVLTARDGLRDRVDGLNAGADDYLAKPFDLEELVARLKALLRRPGGALGVRLEAGNVALDTVGREVLVDGRPVRLSRREIGILEELLRRAERVVPKDMLEESVYGFGEEISSNSIEVAVHRLRRSLETANATVRVHTVRGVGYILQAAP